MDLAGLGQLATQEAVDSYIASAGEALETRANQVLQAYGWLGDVPPGEKLKAMVDLGHLKRQKKLKAWC